LFGRSGASQFLNRDITDPGQSASRLMISE
jgi:hypothetical protein